MSLQFIADSAGKTTGVYIPIKDWNRLKNKFKGIEQDGVDVPEWHKEVVRQRLEDHKNAPGELLDFEAELDDIESDL